MPPECRCLRLSAKPLSDLLDPHDVVSVHAAANIPASLERPALFNQLMIDEAR